jgi:hypothetical protein
MAFVGQGTIKQSANPTANPNAPVNASQIIPGRAAEAQDE